MVIVPVIGSLAAIVVGIGAVGASVAPTCLRPPVEATVVDPFREPACRWCPGNRGLTYALAAGTPVHAAAAGVVTFAGSVAGTGYVVVAHADGRRATYGGIVGVGLGAGDRIAAGSTVGTAAGSELHFGIRTAESPDAYIDPAPLLGRFVQRPRLIPTDGTAPRPPPPPVLRCPS